MRKYLVTALIIITVGSLSAFGRKETIPEKVTDYNFEVTIDNMTCKLCDTAVEKQLIKLDWITSVKGNHTTGLALLKTSNPSDKYEMERILKLELEKINYNYVKLRSLTDE